MESSITSIGRRPARRWRAGDERFGLHGHRRLQLRRHPGPPADARALAGCRRRLTEDGLILLHITNRYLDLRPVLAALAEDAGMVCLVQGDPAQNEQEKRAGKASSRWAVLAPPRAAASRLLRAQSLADAPPRPERPCVDGRLLQPAARATARVSTLLS